MDLEKVIKDKYGSKRQFALNKNISPQKVQYWCATDWKLLTYTTKKKIGKALGFNI